MPPIIPQPQGMMNDIAQGFQSQSAQHQAASQPNELVNYFMQMGMAPMIAVQLASKIAVQQKPTPPIANGVRFSQDPGMTNLLATKYGLSPQAAQQVMSRPRGGTEPLELVDQQGVPAGAQGPSLQNAKYVNPDTKATELTPDQDAAVRARGKLDRLSPKDRDKVSADAIALKAASGIKGLLGSEPVKRGLERAAGSAADLFRGK